MYKYRQQLEYIKASARRELESNIKQFKSAIVRELTYIYKNENIKDLEELKRVLRKQFQVPPAEYKIIDQIVSESQAQISGIWDEYFQKLGIDYESVKAAQAVQFHQLRQDHLAAVESALDNAIRRGMDYKEFRAELIKQNVAASNATTLANTAIAQFDSAYMHEVCEQAGIEEFLYDGMPAQRPFCQQHLGHVYTTDEILAMDNGQGLDVLTSLGGYNCVHFWTPIID